MFNTPVEKGASSSSNSSGWKKSNKAAKAQAKLQKTRQRLDSAQANNEAVAVTQKVDLEEQDTIQKLVSLSHQHF